MHPKFRIVLPFLVFFFLKIASAQKTPEELGASVFHAFQKDSLINLDGLIPTRDELMEITRSMGFEINPDQITEFDNTYPVQVEILKRKFKGILSDELHLGLKWDEAILKNIEKSEKEIPITLDSVENNRMVKMTFVNIYFTCREKDFLLDLGDVYNYRGTWKLGNNIDCSLASKKD